MALATPVFERCDNSSSGTVIGIFHQACADLGQLAGKVRPDPQALAGTVLDALQDNGYGQYDGLIAIMAPALGAGGLAALKLMAEELGRSPVPVPPKDQWKAVGWGPGGTTYVHEIRARERASAITMALKDIADAPLSAADGSACGWVWRARAGRCGGGARASVCAAPAAAAGPRAFRPGCRRGGRWYPR